MPIYEYECPCCANRIEVLKSPYADQIHGDTCPQCKQFVTFQKVEISTTARPIFNGPGWYETTYKKKPVR
jgi:putative FmdB family regulatory protein